MCRWKPSSWTTTRPTVRPPRSLTNSPRRPFWSSPRTSGTVEPRTSGSSAARAASFSCSAHMSPSILNASVGPRLLLEDGSPDPDARRAFPIPSTLFYQTVGLSKLFPRSPRFGRHNMGHLPESDVHEMDAGTAACLMLRRSALDRVGFFDPRYFMFGEDLDLCYRLKLGGWKTFYVPTASAIHQVRPPSRERQRQISYERHRAMWTYHFKHHSEDVSAFGNGLVWAQIWGRYVAERVRDTVKPDKRATT